VKIFIDSNKRQVYLIINYVMFEILLCNCTWYKSCTLAFYITFLKIYKIQQQRNVIFLTYRVNLVVRPVHQWVTEWAIGIRLEDISGGSFSLFDWDCYKLDVRSSIAIGKRLFARRPWFDSRQGNIFCFSLQLRSSSGLIKPITQWSLFPRAYSMLTIRPGFSGTVVEIRHIPN